MKQRWPASRAGPCTCTTRSAGKRAFKVQQFVAIVTEGGAVRTFNLCKQCYSARRLKRGERQVTASKWRDMVEQKAF